MPELIVFIDIEFGGFHTHLYQSTDLSQLQIGGESSGLPASTWAEKISAFVVVSGEWELLDANGNQLATVIGPKLCKWVEDDGIPNDSICRVNLIS